MNRFLGTKPLTLGDLRFRIFMDVCGGGIEAACENVVQTGTRCSQFVGYGNDVACNGGRCQG